MNSFAVNVIARKLAIDAIKSQLRARGTRISDWPRVGKMHRMARDYLQANETALYAQAKAKWETINDRGRNRVVAAADLRAKTRTPACVG